MRWKEITEAPIADFGTYGDMSQEGSFRANDLRAMSNPKWQAKVHRMFAKTEFPINLYLKNAPNDRTTLGLFGNPNTEHSSYRDLSGIRNWSGIRTREEIEKLLDRKFMPAEYEQAITVVLIENEGDDRVALTPWMVAHRIAHAFLLDHGRDQHYDLTNLASRIFQYYNQLVHVFDTRLQQAGIADYMDLLDKFEDAGKGRAKDYAISAYLGKTKGMKNLSNPGEFLVECFAQFMVQGAVSINRVVIPGHERRRELTPEEHAFIQSTAREYYHGNFESYVQKHLPAPQKPRGGYVAIQPDGTIIASFQDPAHREKYEARGLTVKERKPSWQAKKKYADWEASVAKAREMWERLEDEGFMEEPMNRTEGLDSAAAEFEKNMNQTFRLIMVRCIGKFLVL